MGSIPFFIRDPWYNPFMNTMLAEIYGPDQAAHQNKRYHSAAERFLLLFGDALPGSGGMIPPGAFPRIFRAPGRTEIGGNHTDHQNGLVLAAALDLDLIAVAAPSEDPALWRIYSDGFGEILYRKGDQVDAGTPESILHGIVENMVSRGWSADGFTAYITGNVPEGSGLSSSAAFEVLLGSVIDGLFNESKISPIELAQIGRRAESDHFGKPCGLMDQLASAWGGLCLMDFADPDAPGIRPIEADFSSFGYGLCIVSTGSSHEDLTEDYLAITEELEQVAALFDRDTVTGLSPGELIGRCPEIREASCDRAFLRALHVIEENRRVQEEADALRSGDFPAFLRLVKESGLSSWRLLQNVYSPSSPRIQPLSSALAISETVLGEHGACRVHGGGFGGTIQAFVEEPFLEEYRRIMDRLLGDGACRICRICPVGAVEIK